MASLDLMHKEICRVEPSYELNDERRTTIRNNINELIDRFEAPDLGTPATLTSFKRTLKQLLYSPEYEFIEFDTERGTLSQCFGSLSSSLHNYELSLPEDSNDRKIIEIFKDRYFYYVQEASHFAAFDNNKPEPLYKTMEAVAAAANRITIGSMLRSFDDDNSEAKQDAITALKRNLGELGALFTIVARTMGYKKPPRERVVDNIIVQAQPPTTADEITKWHFSIIKDFVRKSPSLPAFMPSTDEADIDRAEISNNLHKISFITLHDSATGDLRNNTAITQASIDLFKQYLTTAAEILETTDVDLNDIAVVTAKKMSPFRKAEPLLPKIVI